ncbi:MAG TPA: PP2C family protein-serine/threonine phosphatase [Geodermatophilus sp.]|nr:PP2C family protein-serine/threonine phosphatase [Geodermatophilus sp.]
MSSAEHVLAALTRLLEEAHLAVPEQLPDVVAAAGGALGCTVTVYLVDYEQRHLMPVPPAGGEGGDPLAIDSTLAGRAYRTVAPVHGESGQPRLWLPLLDGVERLGVLDVQLPADTDLDDPELREHLRWFATLAGHLVGVKTPYGDGLDRVRRRRPRTVGAELVWQMLPPLTFGCEGLVVSGMVEPCYELGGDTFDYAVQDGTAHLSVFDAVGHTLRSGVLSAVVLSAYRNGRREHRGLFTTAQGIDEALAEQFDPSLFATGVLAELDLASGRLRYVNAGHPPPLVLRHGKVVKSLPDGRRPPFGLGQTQLTVAEERLEPDDWVVLYTDGITEARNRDGTRFGVDGLTDILERSAADRQPAPETLRRVTHAVMDHQSGVLQDDATLLVAQWATGREQGLWAD